MIRSSKSGVKKFPWPYLVIFFSLAFTVGVSGYVYYSVQKKNITQAQYQELSAIADLKVGQIENWRSERINDAEFLLGSPIFAEYVDRYLTGPRPPMQRKNIIKRLNAVQKHAEYENIILVDRTGKTALVTGKQDAPVETSALALARQSMRARQIVFTDLHREDAGSAVHIDVIAPLIRSGTKGAHSVGSVILRIDPERFLFPRIQAWPTPSLTGETLLVRRDGEFVTFLNKLRHGQGAAMTFQRPVNEPGLPASMAVRGRQGIVTGTDYRGKSVLAALRTVPGSPWFLVSKIDEAEVFESVRKLAIQIGAVVFILILAAGTASGYLWRRDNEALYRSLYESEARRLDEHRQDEERLKKIMADLVRSNQELEQFASVASHDLMEPLRTISNYLQLLELRYKGKLDRDADEFIGFAVDGAVRMQRMIGDLLAYSRVGVKGGAFEPVDCSAVLDRALNGLKLTIEETGAVVTSGALPTVTADASQLAQVFQNLIANAIKFRSAKAPDVHIAAERKEGEWLFSVRDNGIGFDPAHRERIFALFQRLHTTAEYPGSGIGLSVCKKIIERHHGRIWADSEPGKGSSFYFTVPVQRDDK